MPEAMRKIGLKKAPEHAQAEGLFLYLLGKRPPKEQFAQSDDRRGFFVWRLQRSIGAAGAALLAACALYAGVKWLDVMAVRGLVDAQRLEAKVASDEYTRITSSFPVTQTTTENLRATVVEFTKIAEKSASPEAALAHLSQVLESFPQIELDSLVWRIPKSPGSASGQRAQPAPPPSATPAEGEAARQTAPDRSFAGEELEISGRLNVSQRSDYREITSQVQRFADSLGGKPPYKVQHVKLPFDVSSEGTLSGDMGNRSNTAEAPTFTIVLARTSR
jgi:hypothetical protein